MVTIVFSTTISSTTNLHPQPDFKCKKCLIDVLLCIIQWWIGQVLVHGLIAGKVSGLSTTCAWSV